MGAVPQQPHEHVGHDVRGEFLLVRLVGLGERHAGRYRQRSRRVQAPVVDRHAADYRNAAVGVPLRLFREVAAGNGPETAETHGPGWLRP
ncbi:hypothetical protein GT994_01155 [Bifidobacterium longum]|uniref:Uncharacterized protein n=2 Tax=Bifidobacterium longum TaxID=216816 RepID=Q8G789_BIFLO|nr:hypothetical protein BL0383 [Bifidobacterium longum NCC2705]KAB6724087.1 hypothetical protein GBL36_00210 [Bifidobacterium longum]KAB6724269.1 hypothetical protein GBL29_02015 [Bifidobacterium longum]KAB6725345.1 hypothetical protein GBL27_00200 [Bifidobacterium longum]KAB6728608.1 hypothetical protein GBL26_02555 [Bifidobacterium longum]